MPSAARVLSKTIADELADEIKDNAASLSLAVCQFGAVEHLAYVGNLEDVLPAVFIKPESIAYDRTGMGLGPRTYEVSEVFRVCYAFNAGDNTLFIPDKASDDINTIVRALAQDAKLSDIRSTIEPDQIVETHPIDVLWFSDEDALFRDMDIPIRVVTIRWGVHWLARNTS